MRDKRVIENEHLRYTKKTEELIGLSQVEKKKVSEIKKEGLTTNTSLVALVLLTSSREAEKPTAETTKGETLSIVEMRVIPVIQERVERKANM